MPRSWSKGEPLSADGHGDIHLVALFIQLIERLLSPGRLSGANGNEG
jgi:hypothetical protein